MRSLIGYLKNRAAEARFLCTLTLLLQVGEGVCSGREFLTDFE